jgi:hypothetical protein
MNLENAIKELLKQVRESAPENAVAFRLLVSAGEHEVTWEHKNPRALKKANVSMRALNGEWIV